VIDDEPRAGKLLGINLGKKGYDIYAAASGAEGLHPIRSIRPDIILLDLELSESEDFSVLSAIRSWSSIPVIILSARYLESEIVALLNGGADDYLAKPFDLEELLARMNAAFRRTLPASREPVVACGDLKVDLDTRSVSVKGREIVLTPTEYAILACLARNRGKVVPQVELLKELWGPDGTKRVGSLRVHILALRRKIENDAACPELLVTEPGVGYILGVFQ
jgi:two-component system KDP operon response regulator KdpE